ncbi:invasion protein IagB, partial [Salmonella enterica]|nr:invasion protein IagB [Salmonella enterica]EBU7931985.1 invasion protein IagB [Salmonella enterica subsp. enterica serovar Typhimurium]ECA9718814.1 invasion protein IagB [Salmonella enterica subsp. enterica serovar Typhimurium]ECR8758398.1 invasion protein IagB [Salmonella enterica]ECW2444025.1 invasion protein IagB [Salmonella enterica]
IWENYRKLKGMSAEEKNKRLSIAANK